MDTKRHEEILYKQEVYQITGCALDVLKEVGPGDHEKPYENALTGAFRNQNISYSQQIEYSILSRGEKVDIYIPDLIAFGKIVVDTKVIERTTDHEYGQMLNCLRISNLRVGLLINFRHARLEWERMVL